MGVSESQVFLDKNRTNLLNCAQFQADSVVPDDSVPD